MKKELIPIGEDSAALKFLYRTTPGRVLLALLKSRGLSKAAGAYLDSPLSKWLIPVFVRQNGIDLTQYESCTYSCFNDFFTRRVKPELRPLDSDPNHLASPCDGLLRIYPITDGCVIPAKQSAYTMERLLRDKKLAAHYKEGYCLVFRLCVDHYHRYGYAETGKKSRNRFIPGVLHTVRPIALEACPVFSENCRAYTLIKTRNFGTLLQMEIGAMLVGKIQNDHEACRVIRGQEKGRFLYGGSTIILLIEKDKVRFPEEYLKAADQNLEIPVKFGEMLGEKI